MRPGVDYVSIMDSEKIAIPGWIAHHKKDGCRVTPPGEVGRLKEDLKNAKLVKVL